MMLQWSTINSSPSETHFFVPTWHEAEEENNFVSRGDEVKKEPDNRIPFDINRPLADDYVRY